MWAVTTLNDLLFSGNVVFTIRSWNITSGENLKSIDGYSNDVYYLQVVDNNLFTASYNGNAYQWNIKNTELVRIYPETAGLATCVFFYAKILYVGTIEGVVGLWNTANGKRLGNLTGSLSKGS
jgi:WD40 repeat protein